MAEKAPEDLSEKALHERMAQIEQRLATLRGELARIDDQSRMDIGAALESLSEAMERHEEELERRKG